MSKETYEMAKETIHAKRDLLIYQKGPQYMAKETYVYAKRDLICQKGPN